jgi:hypothetical protein
MSKESVLKKQFQQKDVQRLRNVMTGKAGERSTEGIGYTKATEFHKEGDVWTEDGREWTIKDGIKQNITKLDKAKSLAMPMFCPTCKKVMKHNNDKIFWNIYRRCFNCQADFETDLRIAGLWKEYKQNIANQGIDNLKENYILWVEELINSSKEGFVTEAGDVENWKGGINKELAYKSLDETIKYLESLKK